MGFFFILLVIGAIIFFSIKTSQAAQEQWRLAGQRLKLSYQPGNMGSTGEIQGTHNGHRVMVTTFTKGSGNSSSRYTRYRLDYRHSVPVDLMIRRQGMFQEVGKNFGMQDIETGNPDFDNIALVQGSDPAKVQQLLTPALQSAIRDLVVTFSDIRVAGSHVEITRSGRDSDADVIVHTVRRLAGFCEAMMEAASRLEAIQSPEGASERKEMLEEIEFEPPDLPYNPFSTPHPVVPDPPLIPVSTIDTDPLEDEVLEMPPEYAGELAVEEAEAKTDQAIVEPEPLPEEAHPSAEPIDVVEAARVLFGDSGSSLLASRQFEEEYKDRSVTGSGELLRVGRFSYDPVFPNEQGVKATLLICQLAGTYSKIKVIAEVMYPHERYDDLTARVGGVLPVSGICIGQDALLHRLYIKAH